MSPGYLLKAALEKKKVTVIMREDRGGEDVGQEVSQGSTLRSRGEAKEVMRRLRKLALAAQQQARATGRRRHSATRTA